MLPLGEGRVRLSLDEPPEPLAQDLRVVEARRALEELRRAASALGIRRSMVRRVAGHAGGVEEWQRHLWAEYAARYGAEELPPVEKLSDERVRLALELSTRYMEAGVRDAARKLFSDPLFVTGVMASLVLYMAAWAAPEPIFTKLDGDRSEGGSAERVWRREDKGRRQAAPHRHGEEQGFRGARWAVDSTLRVFTRLRLAMAGCSDTATCRRMLTDELRRIADEICTPGSMLNGLITK
jgi:hypothetical protein